MDIKCENPLLKVTTKQVDAIREMCGIETNRLKEGTQKVLDSCSKEEHLRAAVPYMEKTCLVERALLISKGSVEDCKKRIDTLLTSRGLMPEICLHRTIDEFESIQKAVRYVTLPKMNPSDLSRIVVAQFLENVEEFTLLAHFRQAFRMGEYRLYHDYNIAERHVLDLKHATLGTLAKASPILLKKAERLSTDGYGTKIKGIHILNAPPFVDKVVFLLKQGMKPKVASRIMVHSNYEELQEHIAKEVLPRDYGGDEPSLEKLSEAWNDVFKTEESQQNMRDLDHLVSDEAKRSSTKFNEEYLGMPGTFRKLDVD